MRGMMFVFFFFKSVIISKLFEQFFFNLTKFDLKQLDQQKLMKSNLAFEKGMYDSDAILSFRLYLIS